MRHHLASVILLACASHGALAAPALVDGDFENCDVLMGKAKKAAFKSALRSMKQGAEAGDAGESMRYGAVLNNTMACIDEEVTGSSGWGVEMSNADGSVVESSRPTRADPNAHPRLAATLREAIRNYERVAETELDARLLLGKYYSDYHAYLKQPAKGYVYTASVYSAECRPAVRRKAGADDRCQSLRQDRILYNSLLTPAQRSAADGEATAWADRYLARR
jgi:hypothetical protein